MRDFAVEAVLFPLLVQLGLIILAARLFALLFRRLRQPAVVGEIVAGLVLGPSVFGRFAPQAFHALFHPTLAGVPAESSSLLFAGVLNLLSQLGLILLLFLVGLEFDFSHLRWHGRAALAISVAGVALPFGLGFGLAHLLHPWLELAVPAFGFALFLGTALSITAIPVLGRIMTELHITRSRLGTITMTAAAVDDATGWILLASVSAIVQAQFQPARTVAMTVETIGFAAFMIGVARPLLSRWVRQAVRPSGELSVSALAFLFVLLFACSLVTSWIGIFAVFGAFLLGAVLSAEEAFRRAANARLRDFVTAFFLPIYFVYTGLRTDVGSLATWQLWLLCGLVLIVAFVGKIGGCGVAAFLSGHRWREAACIGTLMNTRGLMALVAINLGRDLGVVPDSVFCMLILMALATTMATTPLLLRLMPGTELEPYILRSGFLPGHAPAESAVRGTMSAADRSDG